MHNTNKICKKYYIPNYKIYNIIRVSYTNSKANIIVYNKNHFPIEFNSLLNKYKFMKN